MGKYLKKIKEGWPNADKKKIVKSVSIIGVVCAIAVGVTVSYFQDTEVSSGNQFKAGKLNLKIDNTCHYNGMICTENKVWAEESTGSAADPDMVGTACECTWSAKDLAGELFFNFDDVKPGDNGEDTVSLHIDNNDAWVCAEIANLKNFDNGCDSPENKVDTSCGNSGEGEGELQNSLFFSIWKDNGAGGNSCNNVKDTDETYLIENQPATSSSWPIADSTTGSPIEGGETACLGISWNVPISTSNIIQTDSLTGDVIFSAVQARNMKDFKCADLNPEVCDGRDNNYDNLIDNGPLWTNKGQACSAGIGACVAQGSLVCDANSPAGELVCSAVPGIPGTEIPLDGIDQDCNGIDAISCYLDNDGDGFGGNQTVIALDGNCDTNQQESSSSNDCDDGNSTVSPNVTEVCDGKDNNCDGQIDESFPEQGRACSFNDPVFGTPVLSAYQCVNGSIYCGPGN